MPKKTYALLKVSKSRKKVCCPRFSKQTNTGTFLCTEKCPSVRFFGESRTTYFFSRFTDLYQRPAFLSIS